jgi:hypothetical protein
MADIDQAVRVLRAMELLPLEDCTTDAEEWRQEIEMAIHGLVGHGLDMADPLRFNEVGDRLSRKRLEAKLDGLIQSWAKEKWRAR